MPVSNERLQVIREMMELLAVARVMGPHVNKSERLGLQVQPHHVICANSCLATSSPQSRLGKIARWCEIRSRSHDYITPRQPSHLLVDFWHCSTGVTQAHQPPIWSRKERPSQSQPRITKTNRAITNRSSADETRRVEVTSSQSDAVTARDAHPRTRQSRDSQSGTWSNQLPFVGRIRDWKRIGFGVNKSAR